jgi:hypothetical protein
MMAVAAELLRQKLPIQTPPIMSGAVVLPKEVPIKI